MSQYAISFSERPQRLARRIAVADLVARWAELGFETDPPNASLTFDEDGGERVHTVTLSAPTVAGDDVTFSTTPLEGATSLALGAPAGEVRPTSDRPRSSSMHRAPRSMTTRER